MFRTEALRPSLPSSHPSRIALAFSPCALIISCVWVLSVGEELSGFVGFLVCNGLAPLQSNASKRAQFSCVGLSYTSVRPRFTLYG